MVRRLPLYSSMLSTVVFLFEGFVGVQHHRRHSAQHCAMLAAEHRRLPSIHWQRGLTAAPFTRMALVCRTPAALRAGAVRDCSTAAGMGLGVVKMSEIPYAGL